MHPPMGTMILIFLLSGRLVVLVVVTVVVIITKTTEKSQCFQGLRDFSGRSGCIFNFLEKFEKVKEVKRKKYRNINCDYKVAKTTTATTKSAKPL